MSSKRKQSKPTRVSGLAGSQLLLDLSTTMTNNGKQQLCDNSAQDKDSIKSGISSSPEDSPKAFDHFTENEETSDLESDNLSSDLAFKKCRVSDENSVQQKVSFSKVSELIVNSPFDLSTFSKHNMSPNSLDVSPIQVIPAVNISTSSLTLHSADNFISNNETAKLQNQENIFRQTHVVSSSAENLMQTSGTLNLKLVPHNSHNLSLCNSSILPQDESSGYIMTKYKDNTSTLIHKVPQQLKHHPGHGSTDVNDMVVVKSVTKENDNKEDLVNALANLSNAAKLGNRKAGRDDSKIPAIPLDGDQEGFHCPICIETGVSSRDTVKNLCGISSSNFDVTNSTNNSTSSSGGDLIVSRKELTDHLRWHQGQMAQEDGKFACCLCSKELSSYSSLDRHLLTHTNFRPFTCPHCQREFTTNGNLNRHVKASHFRQSGSSNFSDIKLPENNNADLSEITAPFSTLSENTKDIAHRASSVTASASAPESFLISSVTIEARNKNSFAANNSFGAQHILPENSSASSFASQLNSLHENHRFGNANLGSSMFYSNPTISGINSNPIFNDSGYDASANLLSYSHPNEIIRYPVPSPNMMPSPFLSPWSSTTFNPYSMFRVPFMQSSNTSSMQTGNISYLNDNIFTTSRNNSVGSESTFALNASTEQILHKGTVELHSESSGNKVDAVFKARSSAFHEKKSRTKASMDSLLIKDHSKKSNIKIANILEQCMEGDKRSSSGINAASNANIKRRSYAIVEKIRKKLDQYQRKRKVQKAKHLSNHSRTDNLFKCDNDKRQKNYQHLNDNVAFHSTNNGKVDATSSESSITEDKTSTQPLDLRVNKPQSSQNGFQSKNSFDNNNDDLLSSDKRSNNSNENIAVAAILDLSVRGNSLLFGHHKQSTSPCCSNISSSSMDIDDLYPKTLHSEILCNTFSVSSPSSKSFISPPSLITPKTFSSPVFNPQNFKVANADQLNALTMYESQFQFPTSAYFQNYQSPLFYTNQLTAHHHTLTNHQLSLMAAVTTSTQNETVTGNPADTNSDKGLYAIRRPQKKTHLAPPHINPLLTIGTSGHPISGLEAKNDKLSQDNNHFTGKCSSWKTSNKNEIENIQHFSDSLIPSMTSDLASIQSMVFATSSPIDTMPKLNRAKFSKSAELLPPASHHRQRQHTKTTAQLSKDIPIGLTTGQTDENCTKTGCSFIQQLDYHNKELHQDVTPSTLVFPKKKNSYKDAPNRMLCPVAGCDQHFPWKSSLKRHVITHYVVKPYKCTRCDKSFSTKSNRERHMERLHGIKMKRLHHSRTTDATNNTLKPLLLQPGSSDLVVASNFTDFPANDLEHLDDTFASNTCCSVSFSGSNSESLDLLPSSTILSSEKQPSCTSLALQDPQIAVPLLKDEIETMTYADFHADCMSEQLLEQAGEIVTAPNPEKLQHQQTCHKGNHGAISQKGNKNNYLTNGNMDSAVTSLTKMMSAEPSMPLLSKLESTNIGKKMTLSPMTKSLFSTCPYCGVGITGSVKTLKRHLLLHANGGMLKCPFCFQSFQHVGLTINHITECHGNLEYNNNNLTASLTHHGFINNDVKSQQLLTGLYDHHISTIIGNDCSALVLHKNCNTSDILNLSSPLNLAKDHHDDNFSSSTTSFIKEHLSSKSMSTSSSSNKATSYNQCKNCLKSFRSLEKLQRHYLSCVSKEPAIA